MLNSERMIRPDSLLRWCAGLQPIDVLCDEEIVRLSADCINATVSFFKRVTLDMFEKDGLWAIQAAMSQAIYDRYIKYRNYGVRIANYFECFLVCSDTQTKKRLIQGYGDERLEIGYVNLFEGNDYEHDVPIGTIGEKSDLLWSVYFDSFVVDFYEGVPKHTLFNHNEVLSLQLWNTEGMTMDELDDYVNRVLVEVSITHGLKFRVVSPDELWKIQGEAGEYNVSISNNKYSTIPLQYLEYGLNTNNDRMAYLHLYQVLEYFFVHAQNRAFKESIGATAFEDIESIDEKTLHMILRKYTHTLNESIALRLVIKRSISPSWVKSYIRSTDERLHQYTTDTYHQSKIVVNLDSNDDKLLERLSDRIYFFRCAIAHAKGETPDYIVPPLLCNEDIARELPLLREIAKQVIDTWSRS